MLKKAEADFMGPVSKISHTAFYIFCQIFELQKNPKPTNKRSTIIEAKDQQIARNEVCAHLLVKTMLKMQTLNLYKTFKWVGYKKRIIN